MPNVSVLWQAFKKISLSTKYLYLLKKRLKCKTCNSRLINVNKNINCCFFTKQVVLLLYVSGPCWLFFVSELMDFISISHVFCVYFNPFLFCPFNNCQHSNWMIDLLKTHITSSNLRKYLNKQSSKTLQISLNYNKFLSTTLIAFVSWQLYIVFMSWQLCIAVLKYNRPQKIINISFFFFFSLDR